MRRVVAITGASAGIGRATALRLARDGASIAICGRRRDRLEAVGDEVTRAGGTVLVVVADVTHDQEMHGFVEQTLARWGQLDAMMCNAGFGLYGAIDSIAPEQMRTVMDVNYFGTYNATRAALPVFRRQQRGHLVIISSIVGKRGVPYMSAYSATKFAQVGLAECLRAEVVGTAIHVSVVFPVSTETEFHQVMIRHSGFATRARGPRQSADVVANAIADVLERPRPEVYPHRLSRGLAILNAIAPGLSDKLVRRWGRKPIEQ